MSVFWWWGIALQEGFPNPFWMCRWDNWLIFFCSVCWLKGRKWILYDLPKSLKTGAPWVLFSFNEKKNLSAPVGTTVLTIWHLVQWSPPLCCCVLMGTAPTRTLCHWLRALIWSRPAAGFPACLSDRSLSYTRAECRLVFIEPADVAQHYARVCRALFCRLWPLYERKKNIECLFV